MFDIRQARPSESAEFTFRRLSPDPTKPLVMRVRHLGATNEKFANAAMARKPDLVERPGFDQLAHEREQDMADISQFCAISWNVTRDGKPVECTAESVAAFLKFAASAGYLDEINELRAFCKILSNFREAVSAEDLGKG